MLQQPGVSLCEAKPTSDTTGVTTINVPVLYSVQYILTYVWYILGISF